MPIVFCTTKLSGLIGARERLPSISMDNWNAQLFYIEGKKCLVFVHIETFYSFVLFNVLKKQLKGFSELFIDNFLKQLVNDKIAIPVTEQIIKRHFQELKISTTDGDKSAIGYMNDCVIRLTWGINGDKPTIDAVKTYVATYYNNNPIISQKGITPIKLMTEQLSTYARQQAS